MPNGLTDRLLDWQIAWLTDCLTDRLPWTLCYSWRTLHYIALLIIYLLMPFLACDFYFIKFHGSDPSRHLLSSCLTSCHTSHWLISYHIMKTPFISFLSQLVNAIAHVIWSMLLLMSSWSIPLHMSIIASHHAKWNYAIAHVNYCFSSCKVHHASCIVQSFMKWNTPIQMH